VRAVLALTWNDEQWVLLRHILLAFVLTFAVGFEREIRGAPAGDRTYSLIGTASAAITAVAFIQSPQTIAGVVTGIGFVGAGMVFREPGGMVKGVTSAATLLGVVAIGILAGAGYGALAIALALIILIDLELRYIPLLKRLDARRYIGMVDEDDVMPEPGRSPEG
jgi:putative Mg2+ transporter-C (MgtC) family protein